ncbi:MAG: transposase family protein [Actinomycetota bacterium]|nr:transposase family protein [Actinomycetota bacterium]
MIVARLLFPPVVVIARWAADLPPQLAANLGAGDSVPSESAFRRTLQRLDADHLDWVLGQWAASRGVSRPVTSAEE